MTYKDKNWKWSYSQLTTFEQCPRQFYIRYIQRVKGSGNAFSEYGKLCHTILEKWATGVVLASDTVDQYVDMFDKVVKHPFPASPVDLKESYFAKGYKYFESFEGFEGYEVVDTEVKFVFNIGGYNFTGIIDLILRDKETGKYIILDHKSTGIKNIRPKKKLAVAIRQLYIYSKYVYEKYGEFPEKLVYNVFNDNIILESLFDENEYKATTDWAEGVIAEILANENWEPKEQDYFCWNICDFLEECQEEDAIDW